MFLLTVHISSHSICFILNISSRKLLIPVSARFKSRVLTRSLAGIAGSIPAGCIDISLL